MSVTLSWLQLAGALGGAFLVGLVVYDYVVVGRDIERLDADIRRMVELTVISAAHTVAVEMLEEDDRMDEFVERAQERLDDLSDEMEEEAMLAEVDPIGARVLGNDHDPVRFPPEDDS